jgi:hypothetical protein
MNETQSSSLTVVIGAGASYDCIAHQPNDFPPQFKITQVDPKYRPPLTQDLFTPQPAFNEILNMYPLVAGLSEDIRARLRKKKNRDAESLEQILRQLTASQRIDTKKQVWEIPLYLQELFWTISDKYIISGRSKFSTLVRRVLDSHYQRVLFLTLNYDLLLDKAISEYMNYKFANMDSYIPSGKSWSLVKAHGSVNWARTLVNGPDFNGDHYGFVSELSAEPKFSSETEILLGDRAENYFPFKPQVRYGQKYKYPWMALPAEGEKDFFCPDEHINKTKNFLRDCRNFLFIGFSALDPHVVDLFKDVSRSQRLMFVCGGQQFAKEAFLRLFNKNEKILPNQYFGKSDESPYLSDLGFADFVESEQFEKFLSLDERSYFARG